jgi:hypothetical protein
MTQFGIGSSNVQAVAHRVSGGQSIMCLAEATGVKQSSELTLIENYFSLCWARTATA